MFLILSKDYNNRRNQVSSYTEKKAILKKMGKIYESLPNGDLKKFNKTLQNLKSHQDGMRKDVRHIKKATK
tara:strand:+ start:955 stop:1167 length:213 start_codon:yes stop_codon:yes gene_type:complete